MRNVDRDLWVAEQPLRFGLLELGTRMTVIRLADASLLLHSPIGLSPALRAQLDELGEGFFTLSRYGDIGASPTQHPFGFRA